jgi:hypothetical protein
MDPVDGEAHCKRETSRRRRACESWQSVTSTPRKWGAVVGGDGVCRIVPPREMSGIAENCRADIASSLQWTGWFSPDRAHVAMRQITGEDKAQARFPYATKGVCDEIAQVYTSVCGPKDPMQPKEALDPKEPAPVAGAPDGVADDKGEGPGTCFVLPAEGAVCGKDRISRHGGFVVLDDVQLVGGSCATHTQHIKSLCSERSWSEGDDVINDWAYRYNAPGVWGSWVRPITEKGQTIHVRVEGKKTFFVATRDAKSSGADEVEDVMLQGTDAEVAEWEQTRLWAQMSARLGLDRATTSMGRWRKLAQIALHGDDDPCAQQVDHTSDDGGTSSSGYHMVGTFSSRDLSHTCSIGGDCVLSPGVNGAVGLVGKGTDAAAFAENVIDVAGRVSSRVDLDRKMESSMPTWWKWFSRSANTPSGRYFTHPGPCPLGSLPVANPDTCESAVRQLRPAERQYDAHFVHSTYNFGGTNGLDNANMGRGRRDDADYTGDIEHTRQFNDVCTVDRNAIERVAWDGKGRGSPHSNVLLHGRYYAQSIYAMILELVRAPEANVRVRGDPRLRHPRYAMSRRYEMAPSACSVHNPTWDTYFVPLHPQAKHAREKMATCGGCPNGKDPNKVDWVTYSSVCEATSNDGWHKEGSLAFQLDGRSLDDIRTKPIGSVPTKRAHWTQRPNGGRLPGTDPGYRGYEFERPYRLGFVRTLPKGWEAFLLAPELMAPEETVRERCPIGNCFKRVSLKGKDRPAERMVRTPDTYCTERTRCVVLPPSGASCPADASVDTQLKVRGWFDADAYTPGDAPDARSMTIFDSAHADDRCAGQALRWERTCKATSPWGYTLAPVNETDWDKPVTSAPRSHAHHPKEGTCHIVPNEDELRPGSACSALLRPLLVGGVYHADLKDPTGLSCSIHATALRRNCVRRGGKGAPTPPKPMCVAIIPPDTECVPGTSDILNTIARSQAWVLNTTLSPTMTEADCAAAAAYQGRLCSAGPTWGSKFFPAFPFPSISFVLPPAPTRIGWRGDTRHTAVSMYEGAVPTQEACEEYCRRDDNCSGASFNAYSPLFHCASRQRRDDSCTLNTGSDPSIVPQPLPTMVRSQKTGKCLTLESNPPEARNKILRTINRGLRDAANNTIYHARATMETCSASDPRQQFTWAPTTSVRNIGRLTATITPPGFGGKPEDLCLDSYWGHYISDGSAAPIPGQRYGEVVFRACKDGGRNQQFPHTTRRQSRSQIWRFKAITKDGKGYPLGRHLQSTASSTNNDNTAGTCLSANSDGKVRASNDIKPWMESCSRTQKEQFWDLVTQLPEHRTCRLLSTDWKGAGGCVAEHGTVHTTKDFGQVSVDVRAANHERAQYFCSRPRGTPSLENLVASSPAEMAYWRQLLVGSDTSEAMVDVLERIQHGATPATSVKTPWQKKYWDNVRRAYHMYNTRASTFERESADLWSHLACSIPTIDGAVAASSQNSAVTLIRNKHLSPPKPAGSANNVLQAEVEEYFSNTWLNSRSSFLDRFTTSEIFSGSGGDARPNVNEGDPLSVFAPFRHPFGQSSSDDGVVAYNKDQKAACCALRYAKVDKGSTPLDRTMAFHVRTPKSVFRLGGWGSLASFIMPPALAQNVICDPRETCQSVCTETVVGADKCMSITVGDLTITGGNGCADNKETTLQVPHVLKVEKCHRFNATSKHGGRVCRSNFNSFTPTRSEAVNLSDDMYRECSGGLDDMAGMEEWKAVSCFRYCRTYCQPNTESAACVPGMSANECQASMMGGPMPNSYPRCNPNDTNSPGYWCDDFANKFCGREDTRSSKACACFVQRGATKSLSENPICGNASCANKDAYKRLSTKLTACPICSIVMAQNNCVVISDNSFGDGAGGLDASGINAGNSQTLELKGDIGCGHAKKEGNFVEAREALFHDLRPFTWDRREGLTASPSPNARAEDVPSACIIIPPSTGIGTCTEITDAAGKEWAGSFYDSMFDADPTKDGGAITSRRPTAAYAASQRQMSTTAGCDERAAWWAEQCGTAKGTSNASPTCYIMPRPGETCPALGVDMDRLVRSGGFVHTPAGHKMVVSEGQCASEAERLQGECGGGVGNDDSGSVWLYEWTEAGVWGAILALFRPMACKIVPPRNVNCNNVDMRRMLVSTAESSSVSHFFDRAAPCDGLSAKWGASCNNGGSPSMQEKANTCYIVPPHGATCAAVPDTQRKMKTGGFISTEVGLDVTREECSAMAQSIGVACGFPAASTGWSSEWADAGQWLALRRPFVPSAGLREKAEAVMAPPAPSAAPPLLFYKRNEEEKGRYTVSRARPDGWSDLCVENVLPVTNNSVSLEATHAGCKISMMGAESSCPAALMVPAVFDDFATTSVRASSQLDCDKRADYHSRACGVDPGIVQGSYRQAAAGACIITPPFPTPSSACTAMPHLPRSMFDAWYYIADDSMLGKSDCTAFGKTLRDTCGADWETVTSEWENSVRTFANAMCTKRGMIHEIDAGDGWDRSHAILTPLFDIAVAEDVEFDVLEDANNKFARLCASICENSAFGCSGFEWNYETRHCSFFTHKKDVASGGGLATTTSTSRTPTSPPLDAGSASTGGATTIATAALVVVTISFVVTVFMPTTRSESQEKSS